MKTLRPLFWLLLGLLLSSSIICTTLFATSDLNRVGPSSISTLSGSAPNPTIVGMIEKMNETNIYETTDTLQSIPTRKFGTPGNQEAADILYDKLSSIPELKVEYKNGNFKNIIAALPGIDKSSDEVVMVGAHYDSTSSDPTSAPGATDNACGAAIVLELARVMSQYQFNHTIAFILWNNEEASPHGSESYVEYATKNSLNIPLYFNFDSSCYDPLDRLILDIMYNNQSSWAKDMITGYNTLYGINFTLTYNIHSCFSDHKPFWSHGYPAVMTHEESHGPAHTPSDTIDQVSLEYALKNGQLGMVVISQVAEVQDM